MFVRTLSYCICTCQEEARRHFNCSTLEGAELEDQGILGTTLTHWEKRVFEVFWFLGITQHLYVFVHVWCNYVHNYGRIFV